MLAQEAQQLRIRAPLSTVISCIKLLTDKPFGARSVLADPEMHTAVIDVATGIISNWCLQHKQSSTAKALTAETCSDAMVTVANLLAAGKRLYYVVLCCLMQLLRFARCCAR
jgi:hypothetical protein